jgi:hypothetical protein
MAAKSLTIAASYCVLSLYETDEQRSCLGLLWDFCGAAAQFRGAASSPFSHGRTVA